MAEEFEKFKRFEYRQNSNLVLQREGPGPAQNEPTGEPESLVGRLNYKMGDRVQYVLPPTKLGTVPQSKTTAGSYDDLDDGTVLPRSANKTRFGMRKGASVLDSDITEGYEYKPSNRANSIVYQALLNFVLSFIGEQPTEVVRDATGEILAAMKQTNIADKQKRSLVTEVLGNIDDIAYNKLHNMVCAITDYAGTNAEDEALREQEALHQSQLNDTCGVAVVFDEEDEIKIQDPDFGNLQKYECDVDDEVDEDEGDEDMNISADKQLRYLTAKPLDTTEFSEEAGAYNLEISKIDAHWLQRELTNIYSDENPNYIMATEKEILGILSIGNVQECENKLVCILKYENFNFAKLLLKNRWKVLYCTRLGQAQSQKEKQVILNEMRTTEHGLAVLESLETINIRRNKEKELARNVRREAATLASGAVKDSRVYDKHGDIESVVTTGSTTFGLKDPEDTLKPNEYVDINGIVNMQGSRHNATSKVKLPEGTQRIDKKSYDEIIVQPYKRPKDINQHNIKTSTLPVWTQCTFKGIEFLNPIQSKVFDVAFNNFEENMLICAPTGAGKTNIAMLSILNVISRFRNEETGVIDKNSFKIIYISPMKALVSEQVDHLGIRLEALGISVREFTGDVSLSRKEIDEAQIIVTTPEKFDIISRKGFETSTSCNTDAIKLIIVDEIHLLHDSRGPVLESIVARTIRGRYRTDAAHPVRLIGLSATLPNYEDVAVFLHVNPKKGLFYFDNQYRPVPLLQTYIGIKEKKAIRRYNTMNQVTYEKVMDDAGKNQILIFVHSRRETIRTAKAIVDAAMDNDVLSVFLRDLPASREILRHETEAIKTIEIKELLPYGVAVHHAGLSRVERKLIEDLFADKHIQLLVSTATLAWGVNLPAHTVIIKGTQVYQPAKGCWTELSPMDIMQMMGRGGRPQYDTSGHGIIITNHSELQYYLSLNNHQMEVESQMMSSLVDCVNSEVVLGNVNYRSQVAAWMTFTYMYTRMLKNPALYGCSDCVKDDDKLNLDLLDQKLIDIAHTALLILDRSGLIKYDKKTGFIQPTSLGKVASHYYLKYPTVVVFSQHLKPTMSDIELLRLFSLSHEFKYIPVREEEKIELQKFIERVPIPVKGAVDESSSKVNVLLQTYISKLKLEGFAMMADMVYVQQSAGRIMRAIFEIALKRGWALLAYRVLQLCKMVDRRMWVSMCPLRQFKGIPDDLIRKLEKKDLSWDRFYHLSSVELGELVRVPKMGKILHRLIHSFPKIDLSAYIQPLTRNCLIVELSLTVDYKWDPKLNPAKNELFWIMVYDVDMEVLLHYEPFILSRDDSTEEHLVIFTVPLTEPVPPNYYIRVVSDRWLSSETTMPISLKSLILPQSTGQSNVFTELLDLQPLPITVFQSSEIVSDPGQCSEQSKNPIRKAIGLYENEFKYFNPIQTQTFSSLYNTNDNILITAPASTGKIVCGEFAILRMIHNQFLQNASNHISSTDSKKTDVLHRCVFLTPFSCILSNLYEKIKRRFEGVLGVPVTKLTGDINHDIGLIENHNIILATAKQWEYVSRRWRTRKVLQNIKLLIAHNIHCIDDQTIGSYYEVAVSRMRYISAQLVEPTRIIALGCSVANARDLAEWIGASHTGIFNFDQNIRAVPLEVAIHSMDIIFRSSRLMAIPKPLVQAIDQFSRDKPVIVFTSDRKQCRLTAVNILLIVANEGNPKKFLHISDEKMEGALNSVVTTDKGLAEFLRFGVGCYHQGMTPEERSFVERLYTSGAIQILVATEDEIYGINFVAHLVIIADTKKYTATGYVDYPIQTILEMIGRAGRPNLDKNGVVVMFTISSKKEYYKKFIFEPLPLESRLDQNICDHINAEVVLKSIENIQDAVDWLTWSYYYRRLTKNPNYYGLQGVSHNHVSDHLSELIEEALETLAGVQCVTMENDVDVQALNFGLIASFYNVKYTTIEVFNKSLASTIKRRGLLEIVSAASEYDLVPVRENENSTLGAIAKVLGLSFDSNTENFGAPHSKTLILLYAHFNRIPLLSDLKADQQFILEEIVKLIQALVDVISSNGWLSAELLAMELCQMVVQGTTYNMSALYQLPFFDASLVENAKKLGVEDIYDLVNMDDGERQTLLAHLTPAQLDLVATVCNRYPLINLKYTISTKTKTDDSGLDEQGSVRSFECCLYEEITLDVVLERDSQDEPDAPLPPVYAPLYPLPKEEQWWLLVGQPNSNILNSIKRVTVKNEQTKVSLKFDPPKSTGNFKFVLYFICDSYMGSDHEYPFNLSVKN